jgi:predicted metal-dependent peptidase
MSRGTYSRFNFFADILSGLQTQEDAATKTFSIQVKNGHYLMKYSPEMVEALDEYGAGIVICHELGHAALGHLPRMIRLHDMFSEDKKKQLAAAAVIHVAADYALNSWLIDDCKIFTLTDLKTRIGTPLEEGPTFEDSPMGSYAGIHPSDVDLPPSKSMEWYVEKLSERIIREPWNVTRLVNPEGGQGDSEDQALGDGQGSSGTIGKLSQAAGAMTSEQLDELCKAAGLNPEEDIDNLNSADGETSASELADQLEREFIRMMQASLESTKNRGTMPGNLQSWVEELLKPPVVDWRQELRNYCKTAKPSLKKSTIARPRRKHINLGSSIEVCEYPGKQKNPSYRIVFAIDTSGSVSDSELQEIFTELRGILNSNVGTEVTVVECDTQIGKIYELSGTSDVDTKVSGRGGTSFDPVFEWVNGKPWADEVCRKHPDLLIYATDGECSLPPLGIRIPQNKVLWLISSRGRIPSDSYSWGQSTDKTSGYGDYGRFIKVSSQG